MSTLGHNTNHILICFLHLDCNMLMFKLNSAFVCFKFSGYICECCFYYFNDCPYKKKVKIHINQTDHQTSMVQILWFSHEAHEGMLWPECYSVSESPDQYQFTARSNGSSCQHKSRLGLKLMLLES